ncbi:MAG: hypothetical protein QOH08_231 [Chloroflexota bacterium]|jgi:hypothetical protein|nr:hypothetical protein [Chloroflexota bacterium]
MARRTPSPLISSVNALRGLAAGITMLSLAGMTVYAGGHLHNTAAPLQPAAAATATPAPATTSSSTGRLRLSGTVTTTTTSRAVTSTHRS